MLADARASAAAIGDFAAPERRKLSLVRGRDGRDLRLLDASFMRAPKPAIWRLPIDVLAQGAAVTDLFRLRSFQTMWSALSGRFRDPRLIQLFGRYPPMWAPPRSPRRRTLMLIAHASNAVSGRWRAGCTSSPRPCGARRRPRARASASARARARGGS